MWWLVVPAGLAVAAGVKWLLKEDPPTPYRNYSPAARPPTVLELNLRRLEVELAACALATKVTLIGQPGAGKSSLLWSITEKRCSPPPLIGVQTDATNWSESTGVVLIHSDGENRYVDAPGPGTERHPLTAFLKEFPFGRFHVVVFVWNSKVRADDAGLYAGLRRSLDVIAGRPSKVLFVRTGVDAIKPSDRAGIIADWKQHFPGHSVDDLHFVSNKTGEGISTLQRAIQVRGAGGS